MPGRLFELWARNANASKRSLTSLVAGCSKAFKNLAQNRRDRLADNSKVQREGHVLRVENVHRNHLIKCSPILPVNLPIAGYAGWRVDPLPVFRPIALKFNQSARAWSHEAHLAANDVPDLGQLIQTGGSRKRPPGMRRASKASSLVMGESSCISCPKYSSCDRVSAFTCMLRNLKIMNDRP